ncbi:MAG: nucleotide exchange factor GrpE [Bacteroidales bacterium]|nr:nucleotide exchange factor GrpE [Bacteroidales bacterium]
MNKENQEPEEAAQKVAEEAAAEAGLKRETRAEKKARKHAAEEENEKLRQELGETKDKYIRLMAEFDNYRRRTAKERLELIDTAGKGILEGFLPVVDDCERALEMLRKSEAGEAAIEGTEIIYNKLVAYLKSKGLNKMENVIGSEFNTDFHEAVAQFPAQDPAMKNKVIDVVQQGYMLGEKVVRFAKVVVGI